MKKKLTIISHCNSLNIEKDRDIWCPGLGQTQTCGRVTPHRSMVSRLALLNKWVSNGITHINKRQNKTCTASFPPPPNSITQMNDNINIRSTIAGQ